MRLTIVADDNAVGIDGEFFSDLDLTQLDSSVHAVQWNGEYGQVEYKTRVENGAFVKPPNALITDVAAYQFAIAAWAVAKEAARVAAELEAEMANPVAIPITVA